MYLENSRLEQGGLFFNGAPKTDALFSVGGPVVSLSLDPAFIISCFPFRAEMEGHEADNLIVAYAQPALEKSMEAAVVSADKDLMQLIRPGG